MSVWIVENSSLVSLRVGKTARKEIRLTLFLMLNGRRIKERKVMMRLTDVQILL